ncbi:DUF1428 domain-containing protein [Pontivivens ytuae]|uniref:DUF1428 domain-containing protein n=1 Tax=Pontivivens ytuae TaxID=2789856 RepID=A0A7S9QE39_9RHOB|nr:DUF1428 domain-containing protein [Pontivivens ytuae]QPH54997.1 DUF1428 domain-containing protein [Pontivivens ytuae]
MYVDGFLVPVKKVKLEEYRAAAEAMGKIFLKHGALATTEAVADDVDPGELTSFPRAVQLEEDETVVFSWITWPDRATRDAGQKKVFDDPDGQAQMSVFMGDDPAVAGKRMVYGGFTPIVELTA